MKQWIWLTLAAVALWACLVPPAAEAEGSLRVLKPKFVRTGHEPPPTTTPEPRSTRMEYLDAAVLFAALCAASYLALRTRSRRGMVLLTVFCLLYFGFYRLGCVCSVGSVQNVVSGMTDPGYALPATVIAFFALPLVFTLFFGRTFCAAVCPLGAIQELVVWKPVKLPVWLRGALGLIPPLYLGLAVVVAAAGGPYLICRYDPFVGIFRLGAPFGILVFGAALLLLGLFVGRPYCRFLCPYGVILGWFSQLSKRHVSITPDECINCRLCEDACPYDAILFPTPDKAPEPRIRGVRRLAFMLAAVPVLVFGLGFLGSRLAGPLSMVHREVALAERVRAEELGEVEGETIDSETFRGSGRTAADLYGTALAIRGQFRRGGWWLGGFMGLVIGGRLVALSVRRKREDYVPDTTNCVSCARCFMSCPRERLRLKAGAAKETG